MPSTVKARWVGPFDAQLGPGLTLKPGDEHEVTPGDLLSAHWEPVGSQAKQAVKVEEKKLDTEDGD
jgi:hypothetical protein